MKLFLPLASLAAALAAPYLAAAESKPAEQFEFDGASPMEWSRRLADSVMAQLGDSQIYVKGGKAKWDYSAGLFQQSLIKLEERTYENRYYEYAWKTATSFLTDDGKIATVKVDEYQLDALNQGKVLLSLYRRTGDERLHRGAAFLREQLKTQPRTSDGGFWHKTRYPNQMWLDGLYMGSAFYAEYGLRFNEPEIFDDVAKQLLLMDQHAYDAKTGLFYHGWDEKKEQSWANKETGTSPCFWSRAIGWYGMAMVDILDFLPPDHPARPQILAILKRWSDGIVKYQDGKTGLWYQVTDQGAREGNYFEATAASMFVYTLAKAVNQGYLPPEYIAAVRKGYAGIIRDLIKKNTSGQVSLIQCCSVAGLGYGRSGTFDYYVHEPIVANDLKGVGPFIMAGMEIERMLNSISGSAHASVGWADVPAILSRIVAPKFPDRKFSILDYGAMPGIDQDSSAAITKAIEACTAAGGGHVVIPNGVFLTGPIHLKSNVDLHLSDGATLTFKIEPGAYLPAVFTRWEGVECYNYSALIYAYGAENIGVTGKGTLDGQADYTNWWGWVKKNKTEKLANAPASVSRNALMKMCDDYTPVEKRVFGGGHFLRPNFVQPYRCKNVLIEDVKIVRSPMWELNPVLCTNVTVRGVEISSHGPNNDGCDPESCRDVLIENCSFDTGDDCIAIKSGRNNDGRRVGMPSENLIIRNSKMIDGHGGVTIGSEISGGCWNVFTENCQMDSPELDRALRLKNNAVRGGVLENIYMRNVEVGQVKDSVVSIDYRYEEGAKGPYLPIVRNVVLENVHSKSSKYALTLVGFENAPIRDIRIVDCSFQGVLNPDLIQYTTGLVKVNVSVQFQ